MCRSSSQFALPCISLNRFSSGLHIEVKRLKSGACFEETSQNNQHTLPCNHGQPVKCATDTNKKRLL